MPRDKQRDGEASKVRHPAKYTDCFFDTFAKLLQGADNVLDPFAGTGKIGKLRQHGFTGKIYANELEPEWIAENPHGCDVVTCADAEFLDYPESFFDAICTSPTYGNRMADHHNAKDGSRRNTYTHCLGRQLNDGNTGKMQWGTEYMEKHERIYAHLSKLVKPGGKFVLNVKNHIRRGVEIDVTAFHVSALERNGFTMIEKKLIPTPSLKFGAHTDKRLDGEYIILLVKSDGKEVAGCAGD